MEAGHDKVLFKDLVEQIEEDFEILGEIEKLISEISKGDPKQLEELKKLISKAKDSKNKLLEAIVDKLKQEGLV